MMLVVVCAVLATAGLGFLFRAVVPARPPLAGEIDRLLSPAAPSSPGTAPADTVGGAVWAALNPSGERFAGAARDMAVMGLSPGRLVAQSVAMAVGGAGLAGAAVLALSVGGLTVPAALALWACALTAAAGAASPRAVLAGAAAERRAAMREAAAVVCDLAAVALAAGDGVEAALAAAIGAGAGWPFERLTGAMSAAAARRQPPWAGLEDLGVRLGVGELVEVSHTFELGGTHGARVRDALAAQSAAIRERAATDSEAKAGSVTERMSFPMVLLLAGFAIVIGYPAVTRP
jgi:Flp pilus assembly protein TadB